MQLGLPVFEPGDIVFGDLDGVLIVPKRAEEDAIRLALEKATTGNEGRKRSGAA